jgi:hypothetical protein
MPWCAPWTQNLSKTCPKPRRFFRSVDCLDRNPRSLEPTPRTTFMGVQCVFGIEYIRSTFSRVGYPQGIEWWGIAGPERYLTRPSGPPMEYGAAQKWRRANSDDQNQTELVPRDKRETPLWRLQKEFQVRAAQWETNCALIYGLAKDNPHALWPEKGCPQEDLKISKVLSPTFMSDVV